MWNKNSKKLGTFSKQNSQKFVSDVTSLGSILNWKFLFGKIHGIQKVQKFKVVELKVV